MSTTYFSKNSRSKLHKYHHNAYAAVCPPQHHYTQRHTCILTSYSFYHACPSPPTVHTSCYHCLPTLTIIHIITTHHFNMQIHTALHQFIITHHQEFILSNTLYIYIPIIPTSSNSNTYM